ncbi:MAG: type VI secretion system ATPase TssH [Phycisphaerae bacterium]|nr:type VI secretion system ATPase TssH [Phycisphaerae bacterium]
MAAVDMKRLRQQLNPVCSRALEAGAGACIQRTHYEITPEHVLAPLLDMGACDLHCVCDKFKVDISKLRAAIHKTLEELKTGNSGRPQFSPFLAGWLTDAWQVASLELMQHRIRSGAALIALLREPDRSAIFEHTSELTKINVADLVRDFAKITAESTENPDATQESGAEGGDAAAGGEEDILKQFTTDLTQKARDGRIDPVIGRGREVRQIVDILMRRYQNNPLIVGEPGTGKTAIVEGFALRVAQNDVPSVMQGFSVYSLDVGLLSAGASVKGEFERRLKGVIKAVQTSAAAGKPIILFIDEAHLLIGAGGGADAANLLKPALARGELRTVAATTFAEYKKYFEKDPPFAQRFGLIKLDEPSVFECIDMLRGTKDKFETHHRVRVLDEAVQSAVSMSHQYLSETQLPRKAVSLLDTACARVAVGLHSTPGPIEDLRRRVLQLDTAIRAFQRDAEAGNKIDRDLLQSFEREREERKTECASIEERWKREKALAEAVLKLREELELAISPPPAGSTPPASAVNVAAPPATSPAPRPVEAIKADLAAATAALESYLAGNGPLVPLQVTSEIVSQVLSDWTGIPAGNMVKDTAQALLSFESRIGGRIIGQDHALSEIGKRLRVAASKLQDPNLPLAVFMLVGPSGTGKTETALSVADLIFGGDRFMTTINMTEYSNSMNVSRLIGSAPGLVGYGEGGVLTEAVRQRPYSVVLLDEMEKAHIDVNLLFMQVFDKGALTDSEGRSANFKNTVIMMTSNVGSDTLLDLCTKRGAANLPPLEELRRVIQPELEQRFTPAFVGRTTVIPYLPLFPEALRKIVDLKLNKIRKRLRELYKLDLALSPAVADEIARRCQQITIGARLINLIINETILPEVARRVLEVLDEKEKYSKVTVEMGADGGFGYALS